MPHVTSSDETQIAYETHGDGPTVVLVTGALGDRRIWHDLLAALDGSVRTVAYDRRNRGESTDASATDGRVPVDGAVERELDDLQTLVTAVGGPVVLVGYSSGCHLAALAATRDDRVAGLLLYEPPVDDGVAEPARDPGVPARLADLVAAGRPADAVRTFMVEMVGLPEEMVAGIAASPEFAAMEASAASTVYDATLTTEHPTVAPLADRITVPTAVVHGRDTWPYLRDAAQAAAAVIPGAELRVIDGADHALVPEAFVPELRRLLARTGQEVSA